METSGFRPAPDQLSHVPQQSRRDKLRVQPQVSVLQSNSHHLNLPNNLDQFTLHPDHNNSNNNINVHHVRNSGRHAANFLYDPASEMLDFSRLRNSVEACQDHNSEWRFSQLNPTPAYQSFDWSTTNFASASNLINPSSSDHHLINSGQKYLDPMNILQDHDNNVVTVAYAGTRRNQQDMDQKYSTNNVSNVRGNHHDPDDDHDQNELALLPLSFVNQSTTATLRFGELNNVDNHHHHHDHHHGGLSLSLSSINPGQFQGSSSARTSEIDLPLNNTNSNEPVVIPKPSIISKANCCGKSLQDIVGVSSGGYRSTTGPLGPFTGYATILKSSRFLKPAQQLLDEFCGSKVNTIINTSTTSTCDYQDHNSQRDVDVSGEMSGSANSGDNNNIGVNVNELSEVMAKKVSNNSNINNNNNNNSCASSSTFYGSNEISTGDHQHGGFGSNNLCFGSSRPEPAQQKKAKLLYMQEEVSRKYKQYRQQMQMVVSSFESVAGLSSATPYISVALRAVARHFRFLKSAIADQLKHTRKALGEDLPSPTTGSCSKGAADHAMSTVRLKYMEQSFQKHKSGGANLAFPEPQQHIWRPQRGLPERSVAVLRAWLFEHFLHPYPTDTDKHMLATQTGLTRNQVSNWFINARVRVWKPMVEEIHSLETKGLAEQVDKNPGNNEANQASNDQASTKVGTNVMLSKPLELPGTGYTAGNRDHRLSSADQQAQQSQEKRLRTLECQVPTSMTGTLMGFVPYHRSGLEVWSRAHQ